MRLSQLLLPPLGAPDGPDGLLASAGFTLPLAGGLHSLLPLGQRVLRRIEGIFRSEMDRIGALEVAMPLLQPEQIWLTRAAAFGPQLFRIQPSAGGNLVLAPTHEEAAAILGQACIRTASHLPRVVFQIQPRVPGPGLVSRRRSAPHPAVRHGRRLQLPRRSGRSCARLLRGSRRLLRGGGPLRDRG